MDKIKKYTIIASVSIIVIFVIYLMLKKKRTIITIQPSEEDIVLTDSEITALVAKLHDVISASFFTPVNYAEIYNKVLQNSDYDVIRITNEYNITYNSDLKRDIENELYWIWSSDLTAANQLITRLKDLGY